MADLTVVSSEPLPSLSVVSSEPLPSHPLDSTLNTIKSWWDQVSQGPLNLYQTGKGLVGLATGETERAMGQQNADLWNKAKASYDAKDYTGAAAHALNYVLNGVPGLSLGTSLDRAGQKFQAGDVSGGMGDTLGTATNLITAAKAPEAVGGAVDAIKTAPGAIKAAVFNADPVVAINKAFTFRPNADIRNLGGAIADVKAAETAPVVDNESLLKTIPAAKQTNRAAFNAYIDRSGDATVSGKPILKATAESLPSTTWIENPDLAQKIIDGAKGYSADFTAPELAKILEEKNAELNAFYNRAQSSQQAAVTSGAPEAVVKAQRDAVAQTLYDFLDPENQGAGPREIQQRYGAIQELEEAAQARANAIAREKAVSPAAAGVKNLQALGKLLKLDPEAAVKTWQGTNSLIRRGFATAADAKPLPAPAIDAAPLRIEDAADAAEQATRARLAETLTP